ncbi:MAG: malonyl-CoA decarboxylase domain-containing protein, partial [Pseudomonadales bacterium]
MLIQQTRSSEGSLFNRSLSRLKELWKSFPLVAEDSRLQQQANIDLQGDSLGVLRQEIQYCLNQAVGEMATRKQAVLIAHQYLELSPLGKERFLNLLAEDFDLDYEAVKKTINNWQPNPASTTKLRQALESPRLTLLRQFNELPDGIKFLVNMRADLLNIKDKSEALQGLQQEMKQLLHAWFDLGFLQLQKITWDSPTSLLEKLIEYEAVHAINGWSDLKNRLAKDRCCYAFFHPQMPDEPLIFIEVALTQGLAGEMDPLLDEGAPLLDTELADTAIFYSISNTQRGLAGISFGNFLIKNVVAQLLQQYPHLKQFSTLSPIPGFNKWLRLNQEKAMAQLSDEQTKQLNDYYDELGLEANI